MKMFIIFLIIFLVAGIGLCIFYRNESSSLPQTVIEKGFKTKSIVFGGKDREYLIYTPDSIKVDISIPLVFVFHGNGETAAHIAQLTGFNDEAANRGWIVVYPQGYEKNWNAGKGKGAEASEEDDVGFIMALLNELQKKYPIDSHRVYMTGISNGAQLVDLLTCTHPEKFAAAGMIAHTHNNVCSSVLPISIVTMHGTADTLVPFNGGGAYNVSSHEETVNFYKQRNGVPLIPKEDYTKGKAWVRIYGPGKLSTEVVDVVLKDGGHTWPDGFVERPILTEKLLGETNRDINATKFLCDFFTRFSRE